MGNEYFALLKSYYSSGSNIILKNNNLKTITENVSADYKKATLINTGAPGCDALILSGIIDALPGGRKTLSPAEDELIQHILIDLDLGYSDKYLFSHKECIWKYVSATIKNASRQITCETAFTR